MFNKYAAAQLAEEHTYGRMLKRAQGRVYRNTLLKYAAEASVADDPNTLRSILAKIKGIDIMENASDAAGTYGTDIARESLRSATVGADIRGLLSLLGGGGFVDGLGDGAVLGGVSGGPRGSFDAWKKSVSQDTKRHSQN